jgi:chemotaxis protein CheX
MTTATINLPAVLDLKAAGPLKTQIETHMGSPLDIDVSGVERMGGLCLQVLLAAAETWRAQDLPFRLINPGDSARNDVRLLGAGHLLQGADAC